MVEGICTMKFSHFVPTNSPWQSQGPQGQGSGQLPKVRHHPDVRKVLCHGRSSSGGVVDGMASPAEHTQPLAADRVVCVPALNHSESQLTSKISVVGSSEEPRYLGVSCAASLPVQWALR